MLCIFLAGSRCQEFSVPLILGVTDILIEKGLLTEDEIAREIARLTAVETGDGP